MKKVIPQQILKKDKSKFLGMLQVQPENVEFASQDKDEKVFIVARKDISTNFWWIMELIIVGLSPFFLIYIFSYLKENKIIQIEIPFSIIIIFLLVLYSIIFTIAVMRFTQWYYNVFIVTNKRIIYYIFKPLTGYKTSEANLQRIQDVSESVKGILPTFFDYGDLVIQTAGERVSFRIKQVPRPTWLRDTIIDLIKYTKNI